MAGESQTTARHSFKLRLLMLMVAVVLLGAAVLIGADMLDRIVAHVRIVP